MGDCKEIYDAMNQHRKEQRLSDKEKNTQILIKEGIKFKSNNDGVHLIIGEWSFWPSTNKFFHTKTGKKGYGVHKLLNLLKDK